MLHNIGRQSFAGRREEPPTYMHLHPSLSSDVPLRVLVLAVGNLGTAKVSARAEERRRVTGKAAAESHSQYRKAMVVSCDRALFFKRANGNASLKWLVR